MATTTTEVEGRTRLRLRVVDFRYGPDLAHWSWLLAEDRPGIPTYVGRAASREEAERLVGVYDDLWDYHLRLGRFGGSGGRRPDLAHWRRQLDVIEWSGGAGVQSLDPADRRAPAGILRAYLPPAPGL
jgi:hypothetical protein